MSRWFISFPNFADYAVQTTTPARVFFKNGITMSNTAIMHILRHSESTGVNRLVLLALAAHCNEARADMAAWPTITTLAALANIKRPSASRAIKQLIESGELCLTGDRVGRNAVYKITISRYANVTPRYADEIHPPYHHVTLDVTPRYADRNTTLHKQETTRNKQEILCAIDPKKAPSSSPAKTDVSEKKVDDYDWRLDAFEILWHNYPTARKVGRNAAIKAFCKAAKTQDLAREIIKGIMRHADPKCLFCTTNNKMTKYSNTF